MEALVVEEELQADVDVENNKMKQKLECPLCNEIVYSGIGNGCMMCGMILEDDEEFCSEKCKDKYEKINKFFLIKYNRRKNESKNKN